MGYKIKEKGYEFQGVKLGQRCVHKGNETIIIGLDVETNGDFIMIKDSSNDSPTALATVFEIILLKGQENSVYDWVRLEDITLIPYDNSKDYDSLPLEPSPLHAIYVLEGEINYIHARHGIYEPHLTTIRDCVKLIKEGLIVK